jgi:ribonuclease HI
MEVKYWTHPANCVTITEGQENNKHTVQVYTDGSRSENGVGSGIAIFTDGNITNTKKYRLNERCSNNQTEQLAILKALENIQYLETNERTVLVSTDSRITLDSFKNRKNHTYLIKKIRAKVIEMEMQNWKIESTGSKHTMDTTGTSWRTKLRKRWQPAETSTSATQGFRKVQCGGN